jgi:hypothetical protein
MSDTTTTIRRVVSVKRGYQGPGAHGQRLTGKMAQQIAEADYAREGLHIVGGWEDGEATFEATEQSIADARIIAHGEQLIAQWKKAGPNFNGVATVNGIECDLETFLAHKGNPPKSAAQVAKEDAVEARRLAEIQAQRDRALDRLVAQGQVADRSRRWG